MFGRLLKWAIELKEFNIEYRPRSAIKGQVLAEVNMERSEVHPQGIGDERWILETDESSQTQGGGTGMVLRTPKGSTIAQAIKPAFAVSNTEAKYEVVPLGQLSPSNSQSWP